MWIRRSKLARLRQEVAAQSDQIRALLKTQETLNELLAQLILEHRAEIQAERVRAQIAEQSVGQVQELMLLLERALRRHVEEEPINKPSVLVPTYTSEQS